MRPLSALAAEPGALEEPLVTLSPAVGSSRRWETVPFSALDLAPEAVGEQQPIEATRSSPEQSAIGQVWIVGVG